jgi:hypothetical protein
MFVPGFVAEMLIESGLDLPAYKFVAAVANSLLADHIVFQSYVSTSSPGKKKPQKDKVTETQRSRSFIPVVEPTIPAPSNIPVSNTYRYR